MIVVVFLVDKFGCCFMVCGVIIFMWILCFIVGIIGVVFEIKVIIYVFVFFVCFWNVGIVGNGVVGWGYVGEMFL